MLVLDEARTWVEETGLCHYHPKKHATPSVAPSFIEAVAGRETPTPDNKLLQHSEELLVRLELSDVAVRLNLAGQPTLVPDYAVATWVLPYVYALRGDRDWRRTPQLTGSRQVSPLAIQAYKLLEQGDATISQLRTALGREVTEAAVLRSITELWQQLRIIPVTPAPGAAPKWQLLRHRFQKAIAEGASTSQVTAISVLASIYLQAVIAASMEEVELFLAPLTSRSKVREVMRGLVATRQVNTTNVGSSSYFYVAGTLPEFPAIPSVYASSSISTYNYGYRRDDDSHMGSPAEVGFGRTNGGSRPAFGGVSSNGHSNGHSKPEHHSENGNGHHAAPKPHTEHKPHSEHKPAARNGSWKSNGASRPDSRSRSSATSSRSSATPARNGASRPSASRNGSHASSARPATSRGSSTRSGASSRPSASRSAARPTSARPSSARPAAKRPVSGKASVGRSSSTRTGSARTAAKRPTSAARPARKPVAKSAAKRFTPTRKPAGKRK